MPSSIRPPQSWSSVAAVIAVIAGERPGIWKIAEPILIVDVCPASQPRIVAASEPYASAVQTLVVAEALGLLDDLELVLARQAEPPVADVHAELHASSFPGRHSTFQRAGGGVPSRRASLCHAPARRSTTSAWRSTACRSARGGDARRASATNEIIVGAYSDRARRRVPDARRPPLRRPHELRLLRARVGPLRGRAARPPRDAGELRVLEGQLEASLLAEERVDLGAAIAEHEALRAAHAAERRRDAPKERTRRGRWAWLRAGRYSAEEERALERLEAELEALRAREPIV